MTTTKYQVCGKQNHVLRDEIKGDTKKGNNFHAVGISPWSLAAFVIAYLIDILLQEPAGRLFREKLILFNQGGTANIHFTCKQTLNIIGSGA